MKLLMNFEITKGYENWKSVFIGNQDAAVYQSVLIISKKHDDLFELLSEKQDEIDWENFEYPEPETSEEEN